FTWTAFHEWGLERGDRLILENTQALRPHLEDATPYLRDAPRELAQEIAHVRDQYLGQLEAIGVDNLAIGALRQGRIADALALDRQALAISPDFAQAHVNLGSLLQRSGQLEAARAEY